MHWVSREKFQGHLRVHAVRPKSAPAIQRCGSSYSPTAPHCCLSSDVSGWRRLRGGVHGRTRLLETALWLPQLLPLLLLLRLLPLLLRRRTV